MSEIKLKTAEDLKGLINYLEPEQIDFLYNFINAFGSITTNDELMKLAAIETYDVALPIIAVEHMENNHPWFKKENYVMDYSDNSMGQFKNWKEGIIEHFQELMKDKYIRILTRATLTPKK